ncbi:MAG: hypothetical protein ACTSW4_02570, partial [Candidatus Ranarchaeia archaeon]
QNAKFRNQTSFGNPREQFLSKINSPQISSSATGYFSLMNTRTKYSPPLYRYKHDFREPFIGTLGLITNSR